MRGRIPKPTSLKLLEGTRKDRVNPSEPTFAPAADLTPPSWLYKTARDHWNELAPYLKKAGLLTEGDKFALALLCEAYGRFQHDPDCEKARDLYRRMLSEFGLTPASRSRIQATPQAPKDALADFLANRKGSSRPFTPRNSS